MKGLVAVIAIALFTQPMFGKNRNPDDYPQRAKVLSFARQKGKSSAISCAVTCTGADCDNVTVRRIHILELEIEGQHYTVSCWRCDPLVPVDLSRASSAKRHGSLRGPSEGQREVGQDDYVIISMEAK